MDSCRQLTERIAFCGSVLAKKGIFRKSPEYGEIELLKEMKRQLREASKKVDDYTWTYGSDGESRKMTYDIELEPEDLVEVNEKGVDVKTWLYERLWEVHAWKIFSDYDCTGQWFTTNFLVAHVQGNTYRVVHKQNIDV